MFRTKKQSAVCMITVGHKTISDQLQHLAEQLLYSPDKMSYRKKCAASRSLECPPAKKRNLTNSTVDKWIADNNKALSTSTWLKYDVDTAAHGRVVALKCSVCCQFCDKLIGMRNTAQRTLKAQLIYALLATRIMLQARCIRV